MNELYNYEIVTIDSLKEYEHNSRTHTQLQITQVMNSIKEFGFTNPLLVDEKNIIRAGHCRLMAAVQLGMTELPIIRLAGLSPSQMAAIVIADNKLAENAGWDIDALTEELILLKDADYDLSLIGFDDKELEELFAVPEKPIEPQIIFSEELGEANNYIVLTFNNEIDWLSAQSHFGLKSVSSKRANGKPWSKGIGRVLNGDDYLSKVNEI